jgi:hypothetical protein
MGAGGRAAGRATGAVRRRRSGLRRRLALSAALVVPSALAQAEALSDYFPSSMPGYGTERGVTVLSRLHPGYDPLGVQVDDFYKLFPAFEQSIGFDSNPAPGVAGARGSLVEITHPSLSFGSEDDRMRLGAYFDLRDTRYLEDPHEDRTDYTLAAGAAINIGDGKLTFGIAHLYLHQDRTEIGALATDAPIAIQLDDVRASYALPHDRYTVTLDADVQDFRFGPASIDGAPFPQSYRDRVVIAGGVTVRYDIADQRSALFVLRGTDNDYQTAQPGQPSRDSQGVVVLAGMDYDDDGVWHWRVLLGLEARAYTAAQYKTHLAPVAEADLIWNRDGMNTVTGQLSRTIEDAAQEGVSGYTYTAARLVWDHEYLRNVFTQVRVGLQLVEYMQGGGTQVQETFGLGATWLVSRWLRLAANYDHTSQEGNTHIVGVVGSYGRDVVLMTARLAL